MRVFWFVLRESRRLVSGDNAHLISMIKQTSIQALDQPAQVRVPVLDVRMGNGIEHKMKMQKKVLRLPTRQMMTL